MCQLSFVYLLCKTKYLNMERKICEFGDDSSGDESVGTVYFIGGWSRCYRSDWGGGCIPGLPGGVSRHRYLVYEAVDFRCICVIWYIVTGTLVVSVFSAVFFTRKRATKQHVLPGMFKQNACWSIADSAGCRWAVCLDAPVERVCGHASFGYLAVFKAALVNASKYSCQHPEPRYY